MRYKKSIVQMCINSMLTQLLRLKRKTNLKIEDIEGFDLAFLKFVTRKDFRNYNNRIPKFKIGFVVPVHNQENLILEVLNGIYVNTCLPLRLIVVLDKCTDNTENIVLDWAQEIIKNLSREVNITILISELNLHEALSDNLAFRILDEPEVLVDVQADMILLENNFDKKIIDIFEKHPDIAVLSSRGTESLPRNYKIRHPFSSILNEILMHNSKIHNIKFENTTKRKELVLREEDFYSRNLPFGRFGDDINSLIIVSEENKYIWINETVMRGPLAFRNSTLKEVGYLNTISHPSKYNDHEYCLRVWERKSMRVAYYPFDYLSELHWGTIRSKKTLSERIFRLICQWQSFINLENSALVKFHSELINLNLPKERRSI